MTYNRETSTYTLKSGRVIRVDAGILGLGPDDMTLYEGYSRKYVEDVPDAARGEGNKLSPDERYEIASEMVHRWLQWAEG